jgi:hypothetical protein
MNFTTFLLFMGISGLDESIFNSVSWHILTMKKRIQAKSDFDGYSFERQTSKRTTEGCCE